MKTHSYGILILLILGLLGFASLSHGLEVVPVYALDLTFFRNNSAHLESITSDYGIETEFYPGTGYSVAELSQDHQELFKGGLMVSFDLLDISESGSSGGALDKVNIQIRIPYNESARYIELKHSDQTILDIDLSKDFCDYNKICDLGENEINCQDCVQQVENISEENLTNNPAGETVQTNYILILVAVLAVLLAVLLLLYMRKHSKKSEAAQQNPAPVTPQVYENIFSKIL